MVSVTIWKANTVILQCHMDTYRFSAVEIYDYNAIYCIDSLIVSVKTNHQQQNSELKFIHVPLQLTISLVVVFFSKAK